jgi:peptidoglycan-N-acetylglucosamine deacetylase
MVIKGQDNSLIQMSSWLSTLAGLGCIVGVWFLVPYFYRRFEETKLRRIAAGRKAIVLTYNDGPGAELTPRLLSLLEKYDVRASFFALGRNTEKHPEFVRQALAAGHEVGTHTYDHSNAWKSDPITATIDLYKGIKTVAKEGGDRFSFRPPFGKLTVFGLVHGLFLGLHFGWWTIDSRDSWKRRPIADVIADIERDNGGVVLMHDYDTYAKAPAQPSHVEHVLELTEQIIKLARTKGYRIVTLASLRW